MLSLLDQPIDNLGLPEYQQLRAALAADPKWKGQLTWAETVGRPVSADDMALELVFVICNSGMKNTIARQIYDRVERALWEGRNPREAFGHPGKAEAIAHIWTTRHDLFQKLAAVADADLPEWCLRLPWIGGITCYHAAKNLGCTTVAKPDRWLQRVADLHNEGVQALCRRLSEASGDRVSTVDLVIWWGCATGALKLTDPAR